METEPAILELTPDNALTYLRGEAESLLALPGRHVLGIAGGPGTGKSTLAEKLVEVLGTVAAYVPMDGFHMKHAKLEELGTAIDKGMPHTFEGEDFVDFLAGLKAATGPVSGPRYDRRIEDTIENAFTVPATAKLLVTEGNYLLLATAPWWRVKPLLDRAIFIEVEREKVRARLLIRHAEANQGRFTEERNRAHIERVDLPNYDVVMRSKSRADVAISLITEG